jgi:hypothetical protein
LTLLEQLLEDDTAGDPCRVLKWKHKSLRRLSAALGDDHPASPPTVARLLETLDYSRKVNRKTLAPSSPDRNEQFEYLQAQKQAFFERGAPVIYVDTKKRELIGLFKNAGLTWCRDPHRVNVYDFRSQAKGIAIPYGIYDPRYNRGHISVGVSADTAEFAVDAIVGWWQTDGRRLYPHARELLILADGGGSNGYRPRLWKYALQHRLVDPMSLRVTVCHYPTGASKWNWIEHRLFNQVSANWAGQPLESYETMLQFLKATTTEKGLVVTAVLNETRYQTKIAISKADMDNLNLIKHVILPRWNYTIKPTAAMTSNRQ